MFAWVRQRKALSVAAATLLLGVLSIGFASIGWSFPGRTRIVQQGPVWTLTPSPTDTLVPSATAAPSPTATPTLTPTSTPAPTLTATPSPTRLGARVLPVPVILQELPLSCEAAGMRMMLAALLGAAPSEKDLLACLPRNANPYLGFRGDPAGYNHLSDGSINWDNYGVYAPAVAQTLNRCALQQNGGDFRAFSVSGATYKQVAESVLDGYPVIVWVTKREQADTVRVDTPQGSVQLVFGEHVWVVVGYHEDGTFDVHDPYPQKNGTQTLHVHSFPNWGLFENMAVFVSPQRAELSSRSLPDLWSSRIAPTQPSVPHPRAYSAPSRIRIPRINVDADVIEVGTKTMVENGEKVITWEVADYAAGFHRGSAYPGHPGNTVIAGHNNIRGRVFRHLIDVLPGDDIYLYVGEQEFHYAVADRLLLREKGVPEEIRGENAKWIEPTEDERLTLVSCWPFVKPDHRVVVVARPQYE